MKIYTNKLALGSLFVGMLVMGNVSATEVDDLDATMEPVESSEEKAAFENITLPEQASEQAQISAKFGHDMANLARSGEMDKDMAKSLREARADMRKEMKDRRGDVSTDDKTASMGDKTEMAGRR